MGWSEWMHHESAHMRVTHTHAWVYYRPQMKLREGNVFTPVCVLVILSTGGGGVHPSMQLGRGCDSPSPLPNQRRPLKQTVRILLEYSCCILVAAAVVSVYPRAETHLARQRAAPQALRSRGLPRDPQHGQLRLPQASDAAHQPRCGQPEGTDWRQERSAAQWLQRVCLFTLLLVNAVCTKIWTWRFRWAALGNVTIVLPRWGCAKGILLFRLLNLLNRLYFCYFNKYRTVSDIDLFDARYFNLFAETERRRQLPAPPWPVPTLDRWTCSKHSTTRLEPRWTDCVSSLQCPRSVASHPYRAVQTRRSRGSPRPTAWRWPAWPITITLTNWRRLWCTLVTWTRDTLSRTDARRLITDSVSRTSGCTRRTRKWGRRPWRKCSGPTPTCSSMSGCRSTALLPEGANHPISFCSNIILFLLLYNI